jgi:hypothetical protein
VFISHMTDQKSRLLVAICALLLGSSCVGRGDVVENWEAASPAMKVRVRRFNERPQLFLSHTYFAFEVVAPPSNQWREVMAWRVEDSIAIRTKRSLRPLRALRLIVL